MLRWYPRSWRQENGDVLVGTLLDVAEGEGRVEPQRGEALDLALNGMGTRFAAWLPAAARERAAGFGFATGLAWSLVYFFVEDWMPWNRAAHHYAINPFGPFNSPGVIVTALWVAAGVLILLGRSSPARWLLLGSALAAVVMLGAQSGSSPEYGVIYPSPDRVTFVLLTGLAVIAALGPQRRRLSVAAGAAVWIVVLGLVLLAAHTLDRTSVPLSAGLPTWFDFFDRYLWSSILWPTYLAGLITAILVAAIIVAQAGRRRAAAPLVMAVAPWAGAAIADWTLMMTGSGNGSLLPCIVIVVVWVALASLALRTRAGGSSIEQSRGSSNPA